jgi:hypothetical protein
MKSRAFPRTAASREGNFRNCKNACETGISMVLKFDAPAHTPSLDSIPTAPVGRKCGAWNIGFAPQKKFERISSKLRCGRSWDEESLESAQKRFAKTTSVSLHAP